MRRADVFGFLLSWGQMDRWTDGRTLDSLTPQATCLGRNGKHWGTSKSGKESKEGDPWVALTQVWEERLLEMTVDAQVIKGVAGSQGRQRRQAEGVGGSQSVGLQKASGMDDTKETITRARQRRAMV